MSFADEIPCLGDSLKSDTLKPKSLGLKMAAGLSGLCQNFRNPF